MKIPFLHNVRRGLATNSSSSHSMVFHAQPEATNDIVNALDENTEFGWDHFILRSLGSKLMYALTTAIGQNWWNDPSDEEVNKEIANAREQYGHLFPEFDDDEYWRNALGGYVDHQSRESDIAELVADARNPNVVIHGGNDNGGYPDRDWGWDEANNVETVIDYDLPEGAERKMLGRDW